MLKMKLELDTEKIIKEGIITMEELESCLQEDFSDRGIYKDEHGFYVGGTFGGFLGWIADVTESELFVSYLKELKWYNSDRSEREDEFIVEDILAYIKNGESWEGIHGIYIEKSSC